MLGCTSTGGPEFAWGGSKVRGVRGYARPPKPLWRMGFVEPYDQTSSVFYACALVQGSWEKGSPKRIQAYPSPVHSKPPSFPPNGPRSCIGTKGPDRGSSLLERNSRNV